MAGLLYISDSLAEAASINASSTTEEILDNLDDRNETEIDRNNRCETYFTVKERNNLLQALVSVVQQETSSSWSC